MTEALKIVDRVSASTARNPYTWARVHRAMPDGLSYSICGDRYCFPYLLDVYQAMGNLPPNGRIVVMKSAQMGLTETALNMALWFLAVKQEGVLYLMPSDRVLGDFAQARVDRAIKDSPYLQEAFTETSNVGLKIGFGQALYLRGAHSKEKLLEIPVGFVIRDEYDMMEPEGAELALSRLGASQYKWVYDLGNPRYPEGGIDAAYKGGTREVWELSCPGCGLWTEPRWPESVDTATERLVCPDCRKPIDKTQGRWAALNCDAPYRSFRLSQLISPTVMPGELLLVWKEAQGDQTRLQLFWNMRIGLSYAPEGTRITDDVLIALPRLGDMPAGSAQPTVMGIDVGTALHVVIRRADKGGIIWAGTTNWVRLARLMEAYNVRTCVIDMMPETTKAKEFARDFPGRVTLMRYLGPIAMGKREAVEDGVKVISVPRTEAIDAAFAKILNREEAVAANIPEDFYRHLKAMTRQIVKTGAGEYAVWVESGPDHFGHAFCYSVIAGTTSEVRVSGA